MGVATIFEQICKLDGVKIEVKDRFIIPNEGGLVLAQKSSFPSAYFLAEGSERIAFYNISTKSILMIVSVGMKVSSLLESVERDRLCLYISGASSQTVKKVLLCGEHQDKIKRCATIEKGVLSQQTVKEKDLKKLKNDASLKYDRALMRYESVLIEVR